jgi:hypothetical protein
MAIDALWPTHTLTYTNLVQIAVAAHELARAHQPPQLAGRTRLAELPLQCDHLLFGRAPVLGRRTRLGRKKKKKMTGILVCM